MDVRRTRRGATVEAHHAVTRLRRVFTLKKHGQTLRQYQRDFLLDFETTSGARLIGVQTTKAELSNADLSTVTSQADAIMLLGEERNEAAHIEIQTSRDVDIGMRLVVYYALGHRSQGLLMESYLVLLRPEADHPGIDGVVRHVAANGSLVLEFHYHVIRIWQIPAEELFSGGLGTFPLAFIGKIDPSQLPELVRRAEERLTREAQPGTIGEFWTSIKKLSHGVKVQA